MLIVIMESEIINKVYDILQDEDIWFTTKLDPTFASPSVHYDLDEYGYLTERGIKQVEKDVNSYIGDGAVDVNDAISIWLDECLQLGMLDYKDNLVTKFEPKPVVDQINAYKAVTESVKQRLEEENIKSKELITNTIQSKDFDADSNQGKIVLRTSKLFTALSDAGYDVLVGIDNGDTTSTVILGDTGAQASITIDNDNSPLKIFVSGNFEITQDVLKTLNTLKSTIVDI